MKAEKLNRINQGKVISVRGSIVDARFTESLPNIHNLLEADGVMIEVSIHLNPEMVLILMDVRMQEMNGVTATHLIRKLQPNGDPKIAAITTYALEGDKERCIEAGMCDYISKPVKMEEL